MYGTMMNKKGEGDLPLILPEIKCVGTTPTKPKKVNLDVHLPVSDFMPKLEKKESEEDTLLMVPRPKCIYKLSRNIKINIKTPI